MFKRNVLAVSMTLAALCSAQAAMADINGGGATLPQALYQTSGVLTAGFAPYIGVGSGNGKAAFLTNDYTKLKAGVSNLNVHWAGSDSKLSATELSTYASAKQPTWGKLIQVPSVGTSVAIPFNQSGTAAVDLSVNELCGVFSGRIADWSGITGSGRSGAIKVVYRSESSGTTELFTRFLNAKCAETGTFNVTTTFGTSYTDGLPTGAVSATGSQGVMTTLAGTDGGITYMSPDFAAPTLAGLDDATKVARVGKDVVNGVAVQGVSPASSNVSAAINAVPLPAVADRGNPDAWVPVFGKANTAGVVPYPTSGYPILGFTNVIFSQCYADATQTTQVRDFFTKHYGSSANNDAAIEANAFVPLPNNWKIAIRGSFLTASNALSIGNTNVCNGIGRPQ